MMDSFPMQQAPLQMNSRDPYVEIQEQPQARKIRFRYECEGRSAGSIPGENSTPERRTFPTIKLKNYEGPAIVVVSTVTRDHPYWPHPHAVVGKDCNRGVCTVKLKNASTITFPNLGIQCCKKKEVTKALKNRQQIRVDPFGTGFGHMQNPNNIDLGVVRLCFQVFLPDPTGKFTRIVKPVVSQPIFDRKTTNELVICRIDRHSGRARGGEDVFLLCEKVTKDDIEVRFYEETVDGTLIWEGFGEFGQGDVHRQFAIVFKTPPYRDLNITQPQPIMIQLRRPSDNEVSDPKPFQYMPEDDDPDRISLKRKRKAIVHTENFLNDMMKYNPQKTVKAEPGTVQGLSSEDIKNLLKANLEKKEKNTVSANIPDMAGVPGAPGIPGSLPNITQPPVSGMSTASQQIDLSQLVSTDTTQHPGLFTQLLASQHPVSEPNAASMDQGQAGQKSMVINIPDGLTGTTGTLTKEEIDKILMEVDQLQQTSGLGNYSFNFSNFSFTEPERALSGDLLQSAHDPGVAAHENVSSGEDHQLVNDPQLNAQLLSVKKQLSSLNPQRTS